MSREVDTGMAGEEDGVNGREGDDNGERITSSYTCPGDSWVV